MDLPALITWLNSPVENEELFCKLLFLSMGYESTLFVKCISNSRKGYKAKENTWNLFSSSAQLGALPQNQVLPVIDSIPPQLIMDSELKENPGHEL